MSAAATTRPPQTRVRWFLILSILLALVFSIPLVNLVRHALNAETVSHILLVPFICIYLVRIRRSVRQPGLENPSVTTPSPPRTGTSGTWGITEGIRQRRALDG